MAADLTPEEKHRKFERRRILRRLLRDRDDPKARSKRTLAGLRKSPTLNKKPDPPRKPEKKEYGKRKPAEAKIILPTVGAVQRGPIQFTRPLSPELKAAIKKKQIEVLAGEAVKKAAELAAKEKETKDGD